jgi:hypothetical protein
MTTTTTITLIIIFAISAALLYSYLSKHLQFEPRPAEPIQPEIKHKRTKNRPTKSEWIKFKTDIFTWICQNPESSRTDLYRKFGKSSYLAAKQLNQEGYIRKLFVDPELKKYKWVPESEAW